VQLRLERQARNEALLREVNERINSLDRRAERAGVTDAGSTFGFHCECGRGGGCTEMLWMTLSEYDKVRQQDDRFALVPGHETPSLERVVERSDRYLIVDKVADAEPFVEDDPRGRPSR
jgi:hypothetical protein